MNEISFTFSDTIAGYVTSFDPESNSYVVKTSDEREYTVLLKENTYAMLVRNLGEPYQDATGQIRDMLTEGRYPVHLRRVLSRRRRVSHLKRSSSCSWAAAQTPMPSSRATGGRGRLSNWAISTCEPSSATIR